MASAEEIISQIRDILEDPAIQKNIRIKFEKIITELKGADPKELRLKADKCLNELEEITSDANILPFVRTQVYMISSMLESID
jgi:uncharacterized protein (UPF0147 family)